MLKDALHRLFVSRVILISPSNPGTPQNACILRGAPFGLSSPVWGAPFGLSSPVLETGFRPLTLKCVKPPPAGSPKNHSPRRDPTVLGGTFGARAQGRPRTAPLRRRHVMPLAMRPLRDQMAHCRRTAVQPNAIDTPCNNRYTFGAALSDLTRGPRGKNLRFFAWGKRRGAQEGFAL